MTTFIAETDIMPGTGLDGWMDEEIRAHFQASLQLKVELSLKHIKQILSDARVTL